VVTVDEIRKQERIRLMFENDSMGADLDHVQRITAHYFAWKQIAELGSTEPFVLIESDAASGDSVREFISAFETCENNYDLVFLSSRDGDQFWMNDSVHLERIDLLSVPAPPCMYWIKPEAAEKLIRRLESAGSISSLFRLIAGTVAECALVREGIAISNMKTTHSTLDGFGCTKQEELDRQAESFVYLPGIDQYGYDMCHHQVSVNELTSLASEWNDCLGFNTLGYLKFNIVAFSRPDVMRRDEGMFVKRTVLEEIANGSRQLAAYSCLSKEDIASLLESGGTKRSFHHPTEFSFDWHTYAVK
jgi:hypothetical protein